MTSSDVWGESVSSTYDADEAAMFAPEVLGPAIDRLVALAEGGPVLELAIGTGRIALPLAERGLAVSGVELSEAMLGELRRKPGGRDLPVVQGDMASAAVPGAGGFALVLLVFNTIANLRTQDEQVACFENAARHLRPGGRFVIELGIPPLRRLPPGQVAVPFEIGEGHVGFDTIDAATQESASHHYRRDPDGAVRYDVGRFRYLWPSECDLMARIAGLEREHRWEDWQGSPFTADSEQHVSVWRTPSAP